MFFCLPQFQHKIHHFNTGFYSHCALQFRIRRNWSWITQLLLLNTLFRWVIFPLETKGDQVSHWRFYYRRQKTGKTKHSQVFGLAGSICRFMGFRSLVKTFYCRLPKSWNWGSARFDIFDASNSATWKREREKNFLGIFSGSDTYYESSFTAPPKQFECQSGKTMRDENSDDFKPNKGSGKTFQLLQNALSKTEEIEWTFAILTISSFSSNKLCLKISFLSKFPTFEKWKTRNRIRHQIRVRSLCVWKTHL